MTAREIAIAALEIAPAERVGYLTQVCRGDQVLFDEVLALLKDKPGEESAEADQGLTLTIQSNIGATVEGLIGPYRLIRILGEGGMGVVYHAQQLKPIRREVALKVIKPGMDSQQVISRFESERQAVAMMDHVNIARVFDAGTTAAGRPYFAMEMVDGVPITTYCDSKRLTVKERIELFIPACQAIQHAHQKGIIHRDIKPSNILVRHDENQAVPKVIDFGLAKALGNQLSGTSMLTNIGTVVGTLAYMSPEQAELGRQDIDTRSDVYSLGALLYQLLTSALPLDSERISKSYVEALQRIREEEAQPPSVRLRQLPTLAEIAERRRTDSKRLPKLVGRELDWIVMKALEKDRARRYETVNGMVRDLQRYLTGDPVEAGPPSTAYRIGKFVRKYRLWLATAVVFSAMLVAGAVVSAWMAVRATRAEQAAKAVNDFLQKDLLAQASADEQAGPDTKPDPDLKVRTALDRAAGRIEGKFGAQPLVEASLRYTIGTTYKRLGLHPEGQRQIERAVELRRRVLGGEHPETLSAMNGLADLYHLQGKDIQAEALYSNVLQLQRRILGEENPDTLSSMGGLAIVYRVQFKYADAERLHVRHMEIERRMLGEEHPTTLISMNNLALVYRLQRKYAEAEPLQTKALELNRKARGDEHPETLISAVNLAMLYTDLFQYQRAEPLFTKNLDVLRRVLGEEHSTTLACMSNLALTYLRQGKYTQAEPLLMKASEIQLRILGTDHPSTMATLNNIAALYMGQGKYAESETLYSEIVETRTRVQGREHPLTLLTLNRLAEVYLAERKYARAEELLASVLEARRRVLGVEHPDTLTTLALLGSVQLQQHKYAEAATTIGDALTMYKKTAPEKWERYKCESMLGSSLAGQKKYSEAEPLLISGYEGMLRREPTIPVGNRSSVEDARMSIIQLYQSWGKPEQIAQWRNRPMR